MRSKKKARVLRGMSVIKDEMVTNHPPKKKTHGVTITWETRNISKYFMLYLSSISQHFLPQYMFARHNELMFEVGHYALE